MTRPRKPPPAAARKYLAEIGAEGGKVGGKSTSAKKAAAARANGKKGGRPKKDDLSLDEIASRIDEHLKRFEADDKINQFDPPRSTHPYWHAHAWRANSRIGVMYVSYQGASFLPKAEALTYLRWLDAGNDGKHFEAARAPLKEQP